MATMIPNYVEKFRRTGERQFYDFLEKVAKPNSDYIAWYSSDVDDREPDFILFGRNLGLIVFEVKDWPLCIIKETNPHNFYVLKKNKIKKEKNPYRQAKGYIHNIIREIEADGRLVLKGGKHRGKSKIPISRAVVFPNINRFEYNQNGVKAIKSDKIFFTEDLNPGSEFYTDNTGKCFTEALNEKIKPLFDYQFSNKDLDYLKEIIFPITKIELPKRTPTVEYSGKIERLSVLDPPLSR